MTPEELKAILPPGTTVPLILRKLAERSEEIDGNLSCDFALTPRGNSDAQSWFAGHEEAAKQFLIFGTDRAHSLYGYWLYDGRPINQAPIVYLNGEGENNTVLTNTLEEFLALLTLGQRAVGQIDAWDESARPGDDIEDFRAWAEAEFGIVPPPNPKEIIERARKAHSDLDAWVERLLQGDSDSGDSSPTS